MFYLKYRPQTIGELDNKRIRETLGKTLLDNNWAHAYLFIGPRGTGKTSAARILAKIVNCPDRDRGEEPCNRCTSCVAIAKGNSLDVIEIDAASNTSVDDIRDLREKVKLAPTGSKFKVYIIDEVHMLSTSAFNALLKTLEEPPEHVIFVLATTDPQKLPATITSRCLVYDFGHVSNDELVTSLQRVAKGEKMAVNKDVLVAVAAQSSNSFRDAHKLFEQLSMQSAKLDLEHLDSLKPDKIGDMAKQLVSLLARRQQTESLKLIENFSQDDSDKLKDLVGGLISYLRDVLLFKNGVGETVDDFEISGTEIIDLVNRLVEANTLLKNCPVPQLPLELVVVEFCKLAESENSENSEDQKNQKTRPSGHSDSPAIGNSDPLSRSDLPDFWKKVLEAVKPYNHSLVALLRASRPGEIKEDFLTVEVFYKFHKARLAELRNREILEKVISDIMGKSLKVKFILGSKKE